MGFQSDRTTNALRAVTFLAGTALIKACLVGNAFAAPQVGVTAAINTTTYGTPPGASRRVMVLGDDVIHQHRIETSENGLVQVLLNDGSTFTVGPNSDLLIDEFVYDPTTGTGQLVATLGKGFARFVGGKLSKNREGVSVKTPIGTIGIRGGIANLNLNGGSSGDEATFSLIFGDELSFTDAQGRRSRAFEPGYTIQVNQFGGRGTVRRTTSTDLTAMQSNLSGRPNQNGGARNPPSNQRVEVSGFPNVNSGLSFNRVRPSPKPQVIRSTDADDVETHLVPPHEDTQNRIGKEIEETFDPDIEIAAVRILSAGETFVVPYSSGQIVSEPGAQGLIGLSGGANGNVDFSFGNVRSGSALKFVQADIGGKLLGQFLFSGKSEFYYQQGITADDDVDQRGAASQIPAAPSFYDVPGDLIYYARGFQIADYSAQFAAFSHFFSDGATPVYDVSSVILGLYGVSTDFSSKVSDGITYVRHYDLTTDPVLAFSLGTELGDGAYQPILSEALMINPLVAEQFGSSFIQNIHGTGLYALESDDSTAPEGTKLMASSFLISGAGAAQKSFSSLLVSEVYKDSFGQYTSDWGRRGSQRVAADQTLGRFAGGGSLQKGPDGGYIFGPDSEYLVLGLDTEINEYYSDAYILTPDFLTDDATERFSGSFQVASLDEKMNVTSLERDSVSYTGYAAAAVETTTNYYEDSIGPVLFSSDVPADLSFSLDGTSNEVKVSMEISNGANFGGSTAGVATDQYYENFHFQFGTSADGTGGHRGIFIDMDTYAARDPRQHADSYAVTQGEDTVTQLPDENSHHYLIPSTVAGTGDNALFASVDECTCAFLEWGYWGAELELDGTESDDLPDDTEVVRVHMGTWVAGDILTESELPTAGTASYAGHAVGNVISSTGNNAAQYLAAGDFSMSVDFGSRTGAAAVANFDGRDFSADLNTFTGGSANVLSGDAYDPSNDTNLSGSVAASIVRGPSSDIQGAIGRFSVFDADNEWQANGIVAGELQ